MTTKTLNNKNIAKAFDVVLDSLSTKEQEIIKRRAGLFGEKETLQSIGASFSPTITRERVRQIEDTGIKKMGRVVQTTILFDIQDKALEFLKLHGGVMSRDKLMNTLIKEFNLESNINASIIDFIIQSDYEIIKKSKQKLGCKIYFYLSDVNKSIIDGVHTEALKILKKKKDVINQTNIYELIATTSKDNLSIPFIDSVLELFEDIVKGENNLIGMSKWKILNPKTLKDKAIYVLKKNKLPMHFVEVANKISELLGENVKVNTIHNELIRNNEFVLIGRGIYALKEWGFKPGTVLDVIIDVLNKKGEPMSTEQITKEVLKIREVKQTTIYMNLQNKDLVERVGRNYYQAKIA